MGAAYSVGEVDHLYTFFVQWTPKRQGKQQGNQRRRPSLVVLNKDDLGVMDDVFSNSSPKSWEIITVHEAKWRNSVCSSESDEEEDSEDLLPELLDRSEVLEEAHLQKLVDHLPVRTQGYPWQLAYSTAVHGTSLKTLYRNLAAVEGPVLLVVKDMNDEVFGAFSSHPFKVSNCCYGTGETFLYTFKPDLQVFQWSGENSYFVRGHRESLQIGAGGGSFGLWLDSDLLRGSSFPCHTFHNQPLSSNHDFTIQDLEVWTLRRAGV